MNKSDSQATPYSNLSCQYRFNCAANLCPGSIDLSRGRPACWLEKYQRYQPDISSHDWYDRDWEELKIITWYDVFSLKESWIYVLILVIIAVFLFFCAVLIGMYTGTL